MRTSALLSAALCAILLLSCAGLDERDRESLQKVISSAIAPAARAVRPISEEEEYFVGRAVAARILASYPLLEDGKLTGYVNLVGRTVALHSDRPFTYKGYRFAVLDSGELNAFACPGGTIFITKGIIDAARNEDELAAVLAHEVGHINHKDGIASIKKSRWAEVAAVLGTSAAKEFGGEEAARLTGLFEGSVEDVFKTLVVNGYGREQEKQADEASILYLARAGYDPRALADFLKRLKPAGKGLMSTHPGTEDRIENAEEKMPPPATKAEAYRARTARFDRNAR